MKKTLVFAIISILLTLAPAGAQQVSRADFTEKINILFMKGDYDSLVRETERNLANQRLGRSEKKNVLYFTGLSYMKMEKFGKARSIFSEILEMRGEEGRQDAYISIADSYFHEGDIDRAIKTYEKVLTIYPRNDRISGVYYNLGLCYKAKKDSSKANDYFKKVKTYYNTSFEAEKVEYAPIAKGPVYYIVQLGAFSSLTNAKKLAKDLRRKKFDYYIQKVTKDGYTLYRVRAGKFSNKYYAERLVRSLRRNRFQAKIIEE